MNILDAMEKVLVPPPTTDGYTLLHDIFERQRELMETYWEKGLMNKAGIDPRTMNVDLNTKDGQARIREFAEYVVEELMEAMNTLRNKPWQRTERPTDEAHFYEELSDAMHFLLELFIMCGLNAEKLYRLYFAKSIVNKFRQESDY